MNDDQPPTVPFRTAAASPRVSEREHEEVAGEGPRFVTGDELGRGGMGRVIAAVDTVLQREVAIKHSLADDARFEREARITAQLEHPSIVPIHDAGRDEHGRPYYIMRRIAGEPLAERIEAARDAKARLALVPRFVTAVDAAGFAHARGIVHRDIKPWNILLGAHGETLLIDWGLARKLDEPDDEPGFASGTPGYMAPEQARGERCDARADVYALGATLLDVLSGKIGRGLSSPTRWIAQAAAGTLPPREQIDPDIPVELVAIVGKALAPDPADRYADAGELAADLHAFLDGRLVAAHRYTRVARVVRFARRHRVAVAIAALAVIVVIAIGAIAIRNVIAERDLARAARLDADDRADVLLVDRASGLADHDPTRAAALLAMLPPTSRHALRARDIATIAALHGIEHGAVAHDGEIIALAIAPDGKRLLSAGGRDGTIQIRDLATGAVRTILRDTAVVCAIWTDNGATITFESRDRGLRVVDVATGTVRVLDPVATAIPQLWAPGADDRVRYEDDKRDLVLERSTAGGEPRVLARDAETVFGDGEGLAVAGAGTVRLIDAAGEHVVGHYEGERPATLVISGDGSRIAAAFRATAIEWDVATGAQRNAWPGIGFNVIYAGNRLYGANSHRNGQLDILIMDGPHEALASTWSILWSTHAGPRVAIANPTGGIGLLGDDGYRELQFDHPGTRMIAGRADSPYLAVGSNDGTIRWWDLRRFVPDSHTVPHDAKLCAVDAHQLYARAFNQLLIVPRDGGAMRTIESDGVGCVHGHVGTRVVTFGLSSDREGAFDLIDTATGSVRHYTGSPLLGAHAFYLARDRTLFELGDREPIARWTAPEDLLGAVAGERALGFELADGRLVSVDAGRATTFQPAAKPSVFSLGADGSWWYATATRVYHDDRPIAELSSPPEVMWLTPNGACIIVLADHSLWRADARTFERASSVTGTQAYSLGQRVIGTLRYGAAQFEYVETGERISFPTRDAIGVHALDDDRVFAVVRSTDVMRIDLYTDPVPTDPAALQAWLRAATNAVVEPGNDAVTWR